MTRVEGLLEATAENLAKVASVQRAVDDRQKIQEEGLHLVQGGLAQVQSGVVQVRQDLDRVEGTLAELPKHQEVLKKIEDLTARLREVQEGYGKLEATVGRLVAREGETPTAECTRMTASRPMETLNRPVSAVYPLSSSHEGSYRPVSAVSSPPASDLTLFRPVSAVSPPQVVEPTRRPVVVPDLGRGAARVTVGPEFRGLEGPKNFLACPSPYEKWQSEDANGRVPVTSMAAPPQGVEVGMPVVVPGPRGQGTKGAAQTTGGPELRAPESLEYFSAAPESFLESRKILVGSRIEDERPPGAKAERERAPVEYGAAPPQDEAQTGNREDREDWPWRLADLHHGIETMPGRPGHVAPGSRVAPPEGSEVPRPLEPEPHRTVELHEAHLQTVPRLETCTLEVRNEPRIPPAPRSGEAWGGTGPRKIQILEAQLQEVPRLETCTLEVRSQPPGAPNLSFTGQPYAESATPVTMGWCAPGAMHPQIVSPPVFSTGGNPLPGWGSTIPGHGGPERHVQTIQASPFQGAQPTPPMTGPSMGMLLGPIGAALAKDLVKPELKGNFHDFAVKFPLYLQQLSAGQGPLPDEVKLTLLGSSLDLGGQLELQRRFEQGERVTFQSFWNWLTQKYGSDTQSALREELRTLRPEHEGKLHLAAWRDFESRFKLCYSRLESPNEDEACSLLLQKLPEAIRKAALREQMKRGDGHPHLKITRVPPGCYTEITQLIQGVLGPHETFSLEPRLPGVWSG